MNGSICQFHRVFCDFFLRNSLQGRSAARTLKFGQNDQGLLMSWIRGVVIFALATVVAVPHLYGQTVTLVPYYENLEAPGYYYFDPVSGTDRERDQTIADASFFSSFGGPVVIDSLAFRLDSGASTTSGAFDDFQVRLSTAATSVATLSTTLDDNVGSDEVSVFSGPLVLSSAGGVASPSDFDLLIPFMTPFTYDPLAGDLLLDWEYEGTFSGSSFRIDTNQHNKAPFTSLVAFMEDARPLPDGIADGTLRGGTPIIQFSVTPVVPEPAALMLLGLSSLALIALARQRRAYR